MTSLMTPLMISLMGGLDDPTGNWIDGAIDDRLDDPIGWIAAKINYPIESWIEHLFIDDDPADLSELMGQMRILKCLEEQLEFENNLEILNSRYISTLATSLRVGDEAILAKTGCGPKNWQNRFYWQWAAEALPTFVRQPSSAGPPINTHINQVSTNNSTLVF